MKMRRLKRLKQRAEKNLKRKIVLFDGDPDSKIMIIGEAPGRQEEVRGKPFVGSAGKLLDKVLEKNGLPKKSVYITNIVLWRPPNNRKPLKSEIEKCRPYLIEQIKIVRPEIICTLGNTPLNFFSKGKKITKVHGKIIKTRLGGIQVTLLPTFHPAAILYNRNLQGLFESDIGKLGRLNRQ